MFDVSCIGPEHVNCEEDSVHFAENPKLNNVIHKNQPLDRRTAEMAVAERGGNFQQG